MTPRPVPEPQKGASVLEWARYIAQSLARARIIPGANVFVEETPAGTAVHAFETDVLVEAKTGGSGIGAAASATQMTGADVTIWQCDDAGALTATSATVKAWNKDTANAVGNNKHIWIAKNAAGLWCVVWEQCP